VFFLLQPQIGFEQHILANLINRAQALLVKQDGGSVSAEKHLFFWLLWCNSHSFSVPFMATGFFKVARPSCFLFFKE